MTDQTVWDYLLAFIAIAALAIGLISMAVGKIQDWRGRRKRPVRRRRRVAPPARRARPALPIHWIMSRSDRFVIAAQVTNPNASVRAEIPLLNGLEPHAEPFVNRPELALNAEEITAVARMIEHNRTAAKPSKSSTIAAGFGVSRGGSDTYKRASAIYDALFGQPAPAVTYRELSPEQEAMRTSLRIKQKGATLN